MGSSFGIPKHPQGNPAWSHATIARARACSFSGNRDVSEWVRVCACVCQFAEGERREQTGDARERERREKLPWRRKLVPNPWYTVAQSTYEYNLWSRSLISIVKLFVQVSLLHLVLKAHTAWERRTYYVHSKSRGIRFQREGKTHPKAKNSCEAEPDTRSITDSQAIS